MAMPLRNELFFGSDTLQKFRSLPGDDSSIKIYFESLNEIKDKLKKIIHVKIMKRI